MIRLDSTPSNQMSNTSSGTISDEALVRQFRRFYEKLERIWQSAPNCSNLEEANKLARQVSRQLENLIEMQTLEFRQIGSRAAQQAAQDSRYMKAALADEILLRQDWPAREVWSQHLVETALFRTSIAGEKIFNDITQLLSTREAALRLQAQLYLFMLALGFQGQFRDQTTHQKLTELRRELFQFAYQRTADMSGHERVLSMQSYAHTLVDASPRRMSPISRWKLIFVAALVGMLAISQLLWLWPTWPLREILISSNLFLGQAS